jgi:hypothetical protein
MKAKLHLPAVLSVVVLTAAATAALTSCDDDNDPPPMADAAMCQAYCFPTSGPAEANCPFPTCATGPNVDQCPTGCEVGI